MVFKNNGDKGYITFNYRRDSWKYNDNTRIHLMSGDAERIVDVKGSHQGDVYSWQDSSHKSEAGAPYTHTRYDGMVETRYGKYIAAINQSKPTVRQVRQEKHTLWKIQSALRKQRT